MQETRPDKRPPVADGWAGADMRVFPLLTRVDGLTDQRMDRWTDGGKKPPIELRAPTKSLPCPYHCFQ